MLSTSLFKQYSRNLKKILTILSSDHQQLLLLISLNMLRPFAPNLFLIPGQLLLFAANLVHAVLSFKISLRRAFVMERGQSFESSSSFETVSCAGLQHIIWLTIASSCIPWVWFYPLYSITTSWHDSDLQAIEHFLSKPALAEHTHQLFKEKEFQVLIDIHHILQVPHMCQELLSAEKCPTLSLTLPIYERLVVHWTALMEAILELAHYIRLGIRKIMEYVAMGHQTRVYALAMSELNNELISELVWLSIQQSSTQRQSSNGWRSIGHQRRLSRPRLGWKKW